MGDTHPVPQSNLVTHTYSIPDLVCCVSVPHGDSGAESDKDVGADLPPVPMG